MREKTLIFRDSYLGVYVKAFGERLRKESSKGEIEMRYSVWLLTLKEPCKKSFWNINIERKNLDIDR